MSISKALSYIFKDPRFAYQIGIGAMIWLSAGLTFSLTFLFINGYSFAITRQVILNNEPAVLPDWSDLGRKFTDGLLYLIVTITYLIPGLIIYFIFGMLAVVVSGNNSELTSVLVTIVAPLLSLPFLLISIMFYYAAMGNFAAGGSFSYAFRFAEIAALVRNNMGTYLKATLIIGIGNILILLLGTLACGVGLFAAGPITMMFSGHIIGQAYVKARSTASVPLNTSAIAHQI